MTKQHEALRIADVLAGSPHYTGTAIWQAIDMLRRQHKAIQKLRGALRLANVELHSALLDINQEKVPFDGDNFHESIKMAEQALKDTEGL